MKELIKLSTYFEQNPVANHDTLNRDAEQTVNLSLKFDSQKTLFPPQPCTFSERFSEETL